MAANAKLARMNVALRKPMTQEEFVAWAEAQDGRYEFDGFQPVAMTGGTNNHGTIALNILVQLRVRLRGGPCVPMGSDGGGVATTDNRVRYPEATVTCSKLDGSGRFIPDPVIVFEVVSNSTKHIDRVHKLREYHAVSSIKRYVLAEQTGIGLTVYSRQHGEPWSAIGLVEGDVLGLPEIGIEIPVAEIYERVIFDDQPSAEPPE